MFKNYFLTTFRNLIRNKVNTFINITGLAISIACCIVVYVFVKHEKSFDNFHSKTDRIYRIVTDDKNSQGTQYYGYVSFPMAKALRNDFPHLETVTHVYVNNSAIIQIPEPSGNRKMFEDNQMTYTDEYFLKTFDFPLLAGSADKLLTTPDEVVLTKQLADKFFGTQATRRYDDLIGKTIIVNKNPYRITAILKDIPRNSNVACHMLLPFSDFERRNQWTMNNWTDLYSESYVFATLPENYSAKQFDAALVPFKTKYLDEVRAQQRTYHPQPLAKVHTDNTYGGTYYSTPTVLIIAFITMGSIVLITACINFINLATAQSFKRAKEIGIRKTLGSRNWQLVVRFMCETLILVLIATGIAVGLADWFLEAFNRYLSFIVDLGLHIDESIIFFLVALAILITFLAGFYPAKVMAGFQPIQALKSTIKAKNTGFSNRFSLRKVLVVTQFVVSQLLIIGTIVVATQMKYFYTKDTGYRKDGILTIEMPDNNEQKLSVLRNELMSQPQIHDVTFSSGPPTSAGTGIVNMRLPASPRTDNISTERKFVDPKYLSTFDIKLLAGRDLQESDKVVQGDSIARYNVLLNNKAAKSLGYQTPDDALGKEIIVNDNDRATIVGVTDDFYNASLQQSVTPVLLFYSRAWLALASIKMNTENAASTINIVKKNWEQLYPDNIFKSMTLNDYIKNKAFYVLEDVMYQGFKIFVILSIIIGCMGLYGLVSFLAIQRQKEIGIRKVLGASVNGIISMFSKEFAWLIVIAFIIAAPLAYMAMNTWLQTFVNRIDLHAGYFILAFIVSLFIAALTVGFQAVKAAIANPVKSLRSE